VFSLIFSKISSDDPSTSLDAQYFVTAIHPSDGNQFGELDSGRRIFEDGSAIVIARWAG